MIAIRRGFSAFCCALLLASVCRAGGGPENVFLLVNATSQDSMAIANEYISLRKIPATNVLYLPFKSGDKPTISGVVFRKEILLPALAEMERRKLTDQIDYFVYSCDFPWRVNLASDFPKEKFSPQSLPRGSLTGFTFLHAFVKEKRKEVVSLNTNWYCMEPLRGITISRAFRSQYRWAAGGRRTGRQGLSYMISAMLGVTQDRGNSVSEVITSLRRAKQADGTKPKGTVYFMKHNGARSKPRHDLFADAASQLRRIGVAAQVLDGKFPNTKPSVIGVTSGIVYVDLSKVSVRFLPGTYCDNLTSAGASYSYPKVMKLNKLGKRPTGQISTANFIRHGATAANGTVYEPYAIRQKFPLPTVHVHYANGCSIGEAFYQSVSGPYQQLLVGDPLCQPWADFSVVEADGVSQGKMLRGQVQITPKVSDKKKLIREFELYVDGLRIQHCKPDQNFQLDTTTLKDGHHELRIVARDDTPIETQGRLIVDIVVKNGRDAIALSTKQKRLSIATKSVEVDVVSTTKTLVEVFCNSRNLGSLPTGTGTLKIEIDQLGSGPVKLYAQSEGLRSKPLLLDITR